LIPACDFSDACWFFFSAQSLVLRAKKQPRKDKEAERGQSNGSLPSLAVAMPTTLFTVAQAMPRISGSDLLR